jgi:hypothetical protein
MAPSAAARRGRLYSVVGASAAIAGSLAYVGIGNPHDPHFMFPVCPFKALTGWNCPACGGLRMTHDLLHGNLHAAVVDNVFTLVGLPFLAVWLLVRWRRGLPLMPRSTAVVIAVAAITWTVIRNLPGFPLVPTLLTG